MRNKAMRPRNETAIIKNEKGFAIVYLALIIIALVCMVGIAVDLGYMYIAKTQLQNAADAGALAGAAKLKPEDSTTSTVAKLEAKRVAEANNVVERRPFSGGVLLDGSNQLSSGNDVTVGNWNPAQSPRYDESRTPVNSIKVRTRRTADSPFGQVNIFFSKLFGWQSMGATGEAICGRAAIATAPLGLCFNACSLGSSISATTPVRFYWSPYPSELADIGTYGTAWTNFSETSQANDNDAMLTYFCTNEAKDSCGKTVYTTNGVANSMARQFRCAFKNPTHQANKKGCTAGHPEIVGDCGPTSDVKYWTITIPIFDQTGCPPGSPPFPMKIIQFANLTVSEVYASGGGGTNACACEAYDAPTLTGSMENAIEAVAITCADCDGSSPVLPMVPRLVQ
jgi:Flp pilus assembly protein TadG